MTILNDTVLESNKYLKLNFGGGDLSSDAGLLLIKEFACKLGFVNILKKEIKTNDSASFRFHKDDENLWQIIYQILGAYFEDDCADELTNDPILTAVLAKNALASQPTLSRFFNRLDNNWFKRLDLPASMRKQQIDTIRLKLLKIAAKVVHSARYITFKLCSSCPYKNEFYETLKNIRGLSQSWNNNSYEPWQRNMYFRMTTGIFYLFLRPKWIAWPA